MPKCVRGINKRRRLIDRSVTMRLIALRVIVWKTQIVRKKMVLLKIIDLML